MRLKFWKPRIDRNQWSESPENSLDTYDKMMRWSWEETREHAPDYFQRLEYSVEHAHGHVLEIGAGIGTMTRWLAVSDKVQSILATDAFEEPIIKLKAAELPKTHARSMPVEDMQLEEGALFDTVMLCEVLEHIYLDEEKKMLRTLRDHVGGKSSWIVSTPIGFMPDPHHVRGFSKKKFIKHLEKYYGPVDDVNYRSGYSQVARGLFR